MFSRGFLSLGILGKFGGTWERPGRISAEGCPECGTVGEGWFGTLCKSVQAESLQRVVLSAEMYERVGPEHGNA